MRGLVLIVLRSLRQHALSSVVTVLSVALGIGLVMAVFALSVQTRQAFAGGETGFDAVLGARGSQLQLVLNTVFHLETSPGNIPWEAYQEVKRNAAVKLAVPYAVGDNYRGFRVVGTTKELFTDFEYTKGRRFAQGLRGRVFDPTRREAVLGATAADRTGLDIGDTFQPYHGVSFSESDKPHAEQYVVVGVMEPTNSPSDRVVWIPLEGVFRMEGHVLRGSGERYEAKPGEQIPEEHKEVSAVMLTFANQFAGMTLEQKVNKQGKNLTLAFPIAAVMQELFNKLGWMTHVLRLVAYLVVLVAAGTILASIHNTMNERRREFAILRALGARRSTVFLVIVLEAAVLAGLGSLVGYAVYAAILSGAATVIRTETGVVLDLLFYHRALVLTPVGMVLLGALSGLLPAFKAYSTDVASNLVPSS